MQPLAKKTCLQFCWKTSPFLNKATQRVFPKFQVDLLPKHQARKPLQEIAQPLLEAFVVYNGIKSAILVVLLNLR